MASHRSRLRLPQRRAPSSYYAPPPLADMLRFVAGPGFSEHHTGRAIDIRDPTDLSMRA